ncbi:hypothetical protein BHE74_00004348, partial [Ensete ventricosum]
MRCPPATAIAYVHNARGWALQTRWSCEVTSPTRRGYRPSAATPDHGQRRPMIDGGTQRCRLRRGGDRRWKREMGLGF